VDASLLILPALLGAGALGTGLARRHQARQLAHLLDARSSSVTELLDLQRTVAEQLGPGSFCERVKLCGDITCDEPLTAPWSGELCVAFRDTTTALLEVREESTSTDNAGNKRTEVRWERQENNLSTLERRCSFGLRQGHQSLPVEPEGADLELEAVLNEVEPPSRPDSCNTRQLGTRREEAILRPSGMAFVVAECSDASGTLTLQAPSGSGLFVVRRGSEDDFSRSLRRWRRIWMVSTWLLLATAGSILLLALL
jgi:hypothetical protein